MDRWRGGYLLATPFIILVATLFIRIGPSPAGYPVAHLAFRSSTGQPLYSCFENRSRVRKESLRAVPQSIRLVVPHVQREHQIRVGPQGSKVLAGQAHAA